LSIFTKFGGDVASEAIRSHWPQKPLGVGGNPGHAALGLELGWGEGYI